MSSRTPKWLALALTLLAGVALLAFAACGGDDDDATTAPTGTSQATGAASTNTGDAGDETEEPTDAPDDGGDTDDPFAELENLGGSLDQATGKVTYEYTEDGETTTMIFYQKDGKSRNDSDDGSGDITSYITTSDTTYVCSSSEESCTSYPGGGLGVGLNPYGSFFSAAAMSVYIQAAQLSGVDVNKTSENIAGTDANCYSWVDNTDPSDPSSGKLCFGGDGNLLYQEFTDASGTTEVRATDYSEDVSDSDFEVPYPVSTNPGIPQ